MIKIIETNSNEVLAVRLQEPIGYDELFWVLVSKLHLLQTYTNSVSMVMIIDAHSTGENTWEWVQKLSTLLHTNITWNKVAIVTDLDIPLPCIELLLKAIGPLHLHAFKNSEVQKAYEWMSV